MKSIFINMLLRLVFSFGIAFSMLLLCPIVASFGFSLYAISWIYPGKVVAFFLSALIPQNWVFGNPASDTYWPQVSAAGFNILCAYVFWGIAIFLAWERIRKHRFSLEKMPNKSQERTE